MPRTTILGLMGVVALVALAAVALRESNEIWASCLFTGTLLILGIACLGAAFRRGAYAGFASFGLGYLCLVYGPWAAMEIRPHLATTKLLEFAGTRFIVEPTSQPWKLDASWSIGQNPGYYVPLLDSDKDGQADVFIVNGTAAAKPGRTVQSFERIGHSLFALALGFVGGIAARYFRGTREAWS